MELIEVVIKPGTYVTRAFIFEAVATGSELHGLVSEAMDSVEQVGGQWHIVHSSVVRRAVMVFEVVAMVPPESAGVLDSIKFTG